MILDPTHNNSNYKATDLLQDIGVRDRQQILKTSMHAYSIDTLNREFQIINDSCIHGSNIVTILKTNHYMACVGQMGRRAGDDKICMHIYGRVIFDNNIMVDYLQIVQMSVHFDMIDETHQFDYLRLNEYIHLSNEDQLKNDLIQLSIPAPSDNIVIGEVKTKIYSNQSSIYVFDKTIYNDPDITPPDEHILYIDKIVYKVPLSYYIFELIYNLAKSGYIVAFNV